MTISIPGTERWDYGTVTAVIDHAYRKMLVMAADWLPAEPGDFDPVELDWSAFMGDFRSRYGEPDDMGEPNYQAGMWVWTIALKGVSS